MTDVGNGDGGITSEPTPGNDQLTGLEALAVVRGRDLFPF